jgi:hypothetical protein
MPSQGSERNRILDVQSAAQRDHINNVYRIVFEKLDSDDVRGARHYVYEMDKLPDAGGGMKDREPEQTEDLTYINERWLDLDGLPPELHPAWKTNKAKAERIARALDQLGFLVREGIVPVNILARFYTYPTLKCWYKLCPYVNAVRKHRGQKGHFWEWENLVRMVIAKTNEGEGVWKGCRSHDNLETIIDQIKGGTNHIKLVTDNDWKPPDRSWIDK